MTNDNHDPLDNEKTIEQPASEHGTYLLSAGQSLGQYKIIRPLGRGGMGEVYEVEHTTLGRRYALKLLPSDFIKSPNALERFRREARVMANLEHPNIIRVDEFGETDGRYWLRMELADGLRPEEDGGQKPEDRLVTLADLAKAYGGKIPQETLLPILRQVLQALDYAHGHGAVHRDLKPSNILLCSMKPEIRNSKLETNPNNQSLITNNLICKIADFGLVKLVGEEWLQSMVQLSVQRSMSIGDEQTIGREDGSEGSSTRSMLGTYEYMSPEQKRGEEADARSDLYSVGLMAYRLLTGRGLGMKTPSQIDKDLVPSWDAFVADALEEIPSERLQNAKEGLKLLDRVSQDLDTDRLKEQQERERREKEQAAKAQAAREQEQARRKEAEQIALEKARVEEERKRQEEVRRAEMARKAREAEEDAARLSAVAQAGEKLEKTAKKGSGWKWVMGLVVAIAAFAGIRTMMDAPSPQPSAQPARQPAPQHAPATGQPARTEPVRQAPAVARTGEAVRQQNVPEPGKDWRSKASGMEFVWIPQMKMWVGKYEVTNGEYRKKEPGHDSKSYNNHSLNHDRQPVVYVNFDDAMAYAKWLTERDRASGDLPPGYVYRLPTGDEWMRFAQCDDKREYPWGNEWPPPTGRAGNYSGQEGAGPWGKISGYRDDFPVTAQVDELWCNPWGLYGVGGNVWEVTTKTPNGAFDAWRGASWGSSGQSALRCSGRFVISASIRDDCFGFRLVLSPPGPNYLCP